MNILNVHISEIKVGDTIIRDGKQTTVNNNNIKQCTFMGKSLFGDTYNLGYKKVEKVMLN